MFSDFANYLRQHLRWTIIVGFIFVALTVLGCLFIDKSDPWMQDFVDSIKKGDKIYFGLFFSILGLYLISSLYSFRKDPETFTDSLWTYRKTYYTLFIVVAGIGMIAGYVDYKDWKVLLQLTAFAVFADLAIFQTPNITKIWSAEFQHRTKIEKAFEVNVEFINAATQKLQVFSDVIKVTDKHFEPITALPVSWNDFQRELKRYLHLYTNHFRFRLELFHFNIDIQDDITRNHIDNSLKKLETLFLVAIDNTLGKDNEPSKRAKMIEELLVGRGVIAEPDSLLIIPILGVKSALLGVKSSEGSYVDGTDINNIINLTRIFYWYMS